MNDAVNNPKHYTSDPSGIECIEITRHRNFNVGNAIKYLWHAGLKDSDATVQDLQKAIWYINDEIERLKKDEASAVMRSLAEMARSKHGEAESKTLKYAKCGHGFQKELCRFCNAEANQ